VARRPTPEMIAERLSVPEQLVEVVGAQFVTQVDRELLILPEHSIAEVGAEHVMAVLDLIDDGEKLAVVVALKAGAEDLGDLVRGQSPQAKLTASLEQLVDGKVALEDKIEALFDLTDRIGAR
jgi:putative heme iron utilization protein